MQLRPHALHIGAWRRPENLGEFYRNAGMPGTSIPMVCFNEYDVLAMTILNARAKPRAASRSAYEACGLKPTKALERSDDPNLKERTLFVAIVAVLVTAIALVVMVEH